MDVQSQNFSVIFIFRIVYDYNIIIFFIFMEGNTLVKFAKNVF